MANMRKDKLIMEGKLKKWVFFKQKKKRRYLNHLYTIRLILSVCVCWCRLRIIHAKRTGKREASMGVEENQSVGTPSSAAKRKRKQGGDSDDDEDDDEDSDDPAEEDEDEEEEEVKKVKKVEVYDEVRFPSTLPLFQEVSVMGGLQTLIMLFPSGWRGPGHQHRGAGEADREVSQGMLFKMYKCCEKVNIMNINV